MGLEVVEDLWGDGLLGEGLLEEREMEKGFLVGGGAWVEAEGMVVVVLKVGGRECQRDNAWNAESDVADDGASPFEEKNVRFARLLAGGGAGDLKRAMWMSKVGYVNLLSENWA